MLCTGLGVGVKASVMYQARGGGKGQCYVPDYGVE